MLVVELRLPPLFVCFDKPLEDWERLGQFRGIRCSSSVNESRLYVGLAFFNRVSQKVARSNAGGVAIFRFVELMNLSDLGMK